MGLLHFLWAVWRKEKLPWSYCGSFGPFPEDKKLFFEGKKHPRHCFHLISIIWRIPFFFRQDKCKNDVNCKTENVYCTDAFEFIHFCKEFTHEYNCNSTENPTMSWLSPFLFFVNFLSYSLYLWIYVAFHIWNWLVSHKTCCFHMKN